MNLKNIKLSSVVLFALVIPFIMTYRIGPGETPYWLFGLIFSGLFFNVFLDLSILKLSDNARDRIKHTLLWILVIASIGAAFYSSIVVRRQTSPVYGVHDIIIQKEAAIRFLLHGVNPYETTYFNTPLKDWNYSPTETNPALYHFVMQPFYLISAIPFYLITSHLLFGFFDARIPLFFLFFALLIFASKIVRDKEDKLLFITLLAFNPATLGYLLEGRDDVYMFTFMFASFYFLYKNKNLWAGILMGLAFAVKQSAWPIFPFYFAYLYFKNKNSKKTIVSLLPFAVTFAVIVVPFFAWNPSAFIESTILYLSGNTAHSYPIAGYGLGSLMKDMDIIKDQHSYYPFWIPQVIIGLPLMAWLINWQRKNNSVKTLLLVYGLFLMVFWYLSRYFNNSHLGFISMLLISAYFWPEESSTERRSTR